jgi:hypothetical protein
VSLLKIRRKNGSDTCRLREGETFKSAILIGPLAKSLLSLFTERWLKRVGTGEVPPPAQDDPISRSLPEWSDLTVAAAGIDIRARSCLRAGRSRLAALHSRKMTRASR